MVAGQPRRADRGIRLRLRVIPVAPGGVLVNIVGNGGAGEAFASGWPDGSRDPDERIKRLLTGASGE